VRLPLSAAALALGLLASACTIEFGNAEPSGSAAQQRPSPVPTGKGSAAQAMSDLCEPPKIANGDTPAQAPAGGTTPQAILDVEHQVETVRGLQYERPVVVRHVTQAMMSERVAANFDATYPRRFYERRSRVWQTLGVIPAGSSVRDALLQFQTGQVVGFYNPANGKLVYLGDTDLDLTERFILAHELTHALDDQHFDLSRLDPIAKRCNDERFMAGLGAVEGSAQFFATQVILQFPTDDPIGGGGGSTQDDVPQFIEDLALWPYTAGQAFIGQLDVEGGTGRVDQALRDLPVSTEQVIHPEAYPDDVPQPVDVPDLSSGLGPSWKDVDVMQVGEAWLQILIALRFPDDTAARAASGWDGGIYRAWSDGRHVAIVLKTVWDTPGDASDFADVLRDWLGDRPAVVDDPLGSSVVAAIADDGDTLALLRSALTSIANV
jgi:hypothetical protein